MTLKAYIHKHLITLSLTEHLCGVIQNLKCLVYYCRGEFKKIILFGINFAVLIAEEFLVLNYVLRIDCGNEQFALTCLSYFDRYLLRTVPVRQLASCSNSNLLI